MPDSVNAGGRLLHDVFVSYRQQDPDRQWVREILVPALDSAGIDTFVDYRSFSLGASIIQSMAEGVTSSRYTVAVMSPVYFQSGFVELERIMAQHLGLQQRKRRLIGLMLVECAPPVELQPFLWLDVTTVKTTGAPELQTLCDALRVVAA